MTRTPSNMIPLGTIAPDFTLVDTVSNKLSSLNEFKSETATVIMFISNHCPFVIHVRDELVNLANDYMDKGISFVAICANDADNYPADAPEQMAKLARECQFPFPYLHDESQMVAKAYDAACTPDFYIFDKDLALVYRGQLDDARPGNDAAVNGKDIRAALDAILAGGAVNPEQKSSMGCNIKWK